LDPYRHNPDALRAQSAELDRELAERRVELRRLQSARRWAQLKWVVPALAILAASAWLWREKHTRRAVAERQTVRFGARVTTSNRHGLLPGTRCLVEMTPACYASVSCASFGYSGRGRCDGTRFVGYGNPSCEIDGDHIIIRNVVRSLNPQHPAETISTELVRE
jgi:hypothetical protein